MLLESVHHFPTSQSNLFVRLFDSPSKCFELDRLIGLCKTGASAYVCTCMSENQLAEVMKQ